MNEFPVEHERAVSLGDDEISATGGQASTVEREAGDVEPAMSHHPETTDRQLTSAEAGHTASLAIVSILEFHESFAWVVMVANGLAGVWSLTAHRVEAVRRRAFWWFCYAAHLTIAVQVTIGVIGQQSGDVVAPSIHQFYGFVAFASTAIIAAYRPQLEEWRFLLYGFGSLFLMGLSIRSFFLVGPI